ncbi:MAG: FtsX-like permease family protein [Bacillota bacterium]
MAKWAKVFRRWRLAWAVHVALALMLAAGVVLYGVYAGWVTDIVSGYGARVQQLELPSDLVVLAPEYGNLFTVPSFEVDRLADNWVAMASTGFVEAFRTTCLGPQGAQTLWGMGSLRQKSIAPDLWSAGEDALRRAVPLVEGRWPAEGEVIWPDNDRVDRPNLGDTVRLSVPAGEDGAMTQWQAQVVGFYQPNDLIMGPITRRADVARLTGAGIANTLFIWKKQGGGAASFPGAATMEEYLMRSAVSARGPFLPGNGSGEAWAPTSLGVPASQARALPFGYAVDTTLVTRSTPIDALTGDAEYRRLALTPAVMMLIVLLVVSVTTVTIALILGRAEELGVYKTFGARGASVRQAMTLEMLLTIALGAVVGLAALLVLMKMWQPLAGKGLPWARLAALWLPVFAILCTWAGHTAKVLFDSAEPRALLKKTAQYDWWGLVRIDPFRPER